jgi:hypothetical protein
VPPPQGVPEDSGDEILAALRARIACLEIAPATDLRAAAPSVKRTARSLKYPEPLDFCRGERIGPILDVRVSEGMRERALLLADTFHEAPRVEEFEGEEHSWRATEEAKAEFSRLSGHEWARSWKVSEGAATECDTDEDEFA